ncbi:hypothetical protein IGI04_017189 [Brassica rapa subsp. trilocularis]|uniref:Uncharacterized protein n=3 Tax=Brassica TaxID=3705 RepID=A0A3P6A3K3_BRACM|nr:hypothetical protein IGI04_017189 [Brassica rapa subsp. trilocularis]CAF2036962.1 unnamed protein product [Brassica napus]CAG7882503.1 unnamed protein product [Brassica rapa]CDY69386.1 BnaAnng30270D [Brassica napus]VDC81773.1 unnamed protein product [Brassica rapa]
MKRNRGGGGGVLNLTSTTTVAMNKAIDETFDKEEVGKTTDLANQVVDEITVHRYVSSSLKRRMATKK